MLVGCHHGEYVVTDMQNALQYTLLSDWKGHSLMASLKFSGHCQEDLDLVFQG